MNRPRGRDAGIGKHGSPGGNSSGDIFLVFSTANSNPGSSSHSAVSSFDFLDDNEFDPYYLAAVQCVEEAVIDAMLAAEDMTTLRPPDRVCRALTAELPGAAPGAASR